MSSANTTTVADVTFLREARESRRWTQADLAARLDVSQGYVSLLETGRRPLASRLRRRVTRVLALSPANLPLPAAATALSGDDVARGLGRLGYPGFAHVAGGQKVNPAALVAGALLSSELDARLTEALPWVLARYPDLDWGWLVSQAKLHDLQNRLGYLVALARRRVDERQALRLRDVEQRLGRSRLDRDDPLSAGELTNAERRWLLQHRPPEAAWWRVLTRLEPELTARAAD